MKKLSKKWNIFIIAVVVLLGGFYSYYKINNRNAFEEMYNSYYNVLPIGSIDRMGQIKTIPFYDSRYDLVELNYKDNTNNHKIEVSLTNFDDNKDIKVIESTLIDEGVYLDVSYVYDMNTHILTNNVSFRGKNLPVVENYQKQTKELLEKYNILKEYLQEKSDKLLDTVLTDWKRYSNSSYSKDNMGRLTIEKDEFLR